MTHHDDTADEPDGNDLGPEENTDDSTKSDMGMGGPPAQSATPVGQGDEPGTGAEERPDDEDDSDDADD